MNQVTIEIVMAKDIALPGALQRLFADWTILQSTFLVVYTIKVDFLGDEHLNALDRAFKLDQIFYWTTEGYEATTYNR